MSEPSQSSSPIRSLLGASAIYTLGSVLSRVGVFLLLPLYTHALSLTEYGSLELIFSVSSMASTLIGAGLAHTALRFYFDETEPRAAGRVISTAYCLSMAVAIAVCGVGALVAEPLGRWILGQEGQSLIIQLMFAILVFELTSEICFAYLRVRGWAMRYVGLSLAKLLAQVAVSVYLVAYRDMGVAGVLGGNLSAVLLVWLLLSFMVLRDCGLGLDFSKVPAMYRYSLPLAARAVVGVIGANADRILLRTFVSIEALAIYGLGLKIAQILKFGLIEPFQLGYGPFRFSVMKRDDAKDVQRRVTLIFCLGATLAALLLAAATPGIIQMFSPQEYWSAASITLLVLPGVVAGGLSYCFETGLLIHKSTTTLLHLTTLNFFVSVGLQLAFVPWLGAHGAALASSLAFLSYAAIVQIASNRRYPLDYLNRTDYGLLIVAIVCLGGMLLIADWRWTHQLPLALGLVAVFIGVATLAHRETRQFVSAAFAQVRKWRAA